MKIKSILILILGINMLLWGFQPSLTIPEPVRWILATAWFVLWLRYGLLPRLEE
ncbi:hypothetical protein [Streptococcus merionis]|uniref:hypothetical protein n=1 Tax=Streptococcus merionis TaxID=400065 RepID=UPI00037E3694|nr:hypothetical protein [Streptococcus merionis]